MRNNQRFERNKAWFGWIVKNFPYTDLESGLAGRYQDDGITPIPDPKDGCPTGWMWVRLSTGGRPVPALIGVRSDLFDLPVVTGLNDQEDRVAFMIVINRQTIERFGAQLAGLALPSAPIETRNDPVPMRLIEGGRLLPSPYSGLKVFVEKYPRAGLFMSEPAYDLSASVPGVSGQNRWAGICVNKVGALQTVNGSPTSLSLVTDYAYAIHFPGGSTPLGAIGLTYGQTTIDWNYHVDLRYHHSKQPLSFEQIMTDANGSIMVDANGHVMYGAD